MVRRSKRNRDVSADDGNAMGLTEAFHPVSADGFTTAKSPMDMFPQREIDNDLKVVDSAIREYWGLNPAPQNQNTITETDNAEENENA